MIFGFIMLFIIWLFWILFVQGLLFKLILFFAGWIGIYIGMRMYILDSDKVIVTIMDYGFSWAAVVPTIVCIMALVTTKAE